MIDIEKFNGFDPDASSWTWENVYNKTFRTLPYWQSLSRNKKSGRYMEASLEYKKDKMIYIGGDLIFNFNQTYGEPLKKFFPERVKKSFAMHYSVLNFSLMPRTGGLNLNKAKGKYCDRFDRFIYLLDRFFRTKDEQNPLFTVRGRNKNTLPFLIDYLKSINSIEEYCYYYYLLQDDELIHRLIQSGEDYEKNGVTKKGSQIYLNLARDYWNYKREIYRTSFKLDVDQLDGITPK